VDRELISVDEKIGASVKIVKINVCKAPETSTRFSIMSVPTVMSFSKGRITGSLTGSRPCEQYIGLVQ
jgi:thioredoxin-like negative regulator of GroEL